MSRIKEFERINRSRRIEQEGGMRGESYPPPIPGSSQQVLPSLDNIPFTEHQNAISELSKPNIIVEGKIKPCTKKLSESYKQDMTHPNCIGDEYYYEIYTPASDETQKKCQK